LTIGFGYPSPTFYYVFVRAQALEHPNAHPMESPFPLIFRWVKFQEVLLQMK
jgi:hypothetical protein